MSTRHHHHRVWERRQQPNRDKGGMLLLTYCFLRVAKFTFEWYFGDFKAMRGGNLSIMFSVLRCLLCQLFRSSVSDETFVTTFRTGQRVSSQSNSSRQFGKSFQSPRIGHSSFLFPQYSTQNVSYLPIWKREEIVRWRKIFSVFLKLCLLSYFVSEEWEACKLSTRRSQEETAIS